MPFTSVVTELDIAVILEKAKVAVSDGPLGTLAGVQFAAVFQSPLTGSEIQVALLAWIVCGKTKMNAGKSRATYAEWSRRARTPGEDVLGCFMVCSLAE